MCIHCKYFLRYDLDSSTYDYKKQVSGGMYEVQLVCVQEFNKDGVLLESDYDYPKFRFISHVLVKTYVLSDDGKDCFSEITNLKRDIKNLEKMGFIVEKGDCENEF